MNQIPSNPGEQELHPETQQPVQEMPAQETPVHETPVVPAAEESATRPVQQTTPPVWGEDPSAVPEERPLFQYGDQPQPAAAAVESSPGDVSRGAKILLVLMFLAIVGFCVFCIVWDLQKGSGSGGYVAGDVINVQIGQQGKPDVDPKYQTEDGRFTYEGIAATVMPSIVQIHTYRGGMVIGTGSGIVLSEDGYIATNAHVVNNGDSFSVTMLDGTVYDAARVGYDNKTDIAVMKVDAVGLPPAVMGNSDEAVLGEEVCALGCPAGFSGSISTGIVSGLHRKVRAESDTYEMDCIQTDAAISPGNSGGALVNLYGQVIGITSSKYVSGSIFDSGSYEGLGFAITTNEALPIIEELIKNGYVSGRVRVGIQFYEAANVEQATGMELPEELQGVGVYIMAMDEDAPIAQTELEIGDFIVEMNGVEVTDYDSLNEALEGKRGGDTVTARCARLEENGEIRYFQIEILLLADTSGDY